MLNRQRAQQNLDIALARAPVVALLGPRQCGKTTLARTLGAPSGNYFDLERSADYAALKTAPESVLGALRGLVVIDEVQELPELFRTLRVLADRTPNPARFLILGSVAPELIRGASESLAGRVEMLSLGGLLLEDLAAPEAGVAPASVAETLWLRGGFPRALLAANDNDSLSWRENFVETFLIRDAARLGIALETEGLRRLWIMLAQMSGTPINAADVARHLGVAQNSILRYLDILTHAYLLRRLPPFFANLNKRLVKSPKYYLRDSGLMHALLGLRDARAVLAHPQVGLSWEGFVIEQILAISGSRDAYFYGAHSGAELDLLLVRNGKYYGFECKLSDAPRTQKSMHSSSKDLQLEALYVVYRGERRYPLADKIIALPIDHLADVVAGLG